MKDKTVKITKELAEKLEKRAKESGFETLDNYIIYILRQVLSEMEGKNHSEDDEEVKQKLRDLGYID